MKGVPFVNRRYTKGVPFSLKMGEGLDLVVEPPSPGNPSLCLTLIHKLNTLILNFLFLGYITNHFMTGSSGTS